MEELIISALIERGGVFGLLLSISFGWIVYRERQFSSKSKEAENDKKNEQVLNDILSKINIIYENVDDYRISNSKTLKKISEVFVYLEQFEKVNSENLFRIDKLSENLENVNQERVEELKEVLLNYNKTITELTITLEKIKFLLKNKINEDDYGL